MARQEEEDERKRNLLLLNQCGWNRGSGTERGWYGRSQTSPSAIPWSEEKRRKLKRRQWYCDPVTGKMRRVLTLKLSSWLVAGLHWESGWIVVFAASLPVRQRVDCLFCWIGGTRRVRTIGLYLGTIGHGQSNNCTILEAQAEIFVCQRIVWCHIKFSLWGNHQRMCWIGHLFLSRQASESQSVKYIAGNDGHGCFFLARLSSNLSGPIEWPEELLQPGGDQLDI